MELKKTVSYKQFGAVGDGKTNDMPAIIKTHEYANENGCKVVAEKGAKYYIGNTEKCAVIKTDVDFGDAEFIIDDTAEGVFANRNVAIFEVHRDYPVISYKAEDLAKNAVKKAKETISDSVAKVEEFFNDEPADIAEELKEHVEDAVEAAKGAVEDAVDAVKKETEE